MQWVATHWQRFRLVCVLGAFLIGVAIGSVVLVPLTEVWVYIAVGLAGIGVSVINRARALSFLTVCAGVCGFMLATSALESVTLTQMYNYEGPVQVVSVRYAEAPRQRVLFEITSGEKRGQRFRYYAYDWGFASGARLNVAVEIAPAQHATDRGYGILGTATKLTGIRQTAGPNGLWRLRARTQERVGQSLPEPYASLAVGLLTGANDDFDSNFKEDLQRTGTTHLVAVSGYNLTIVALVLRRFGQRWSRQFGFLLGLLAIAGYVVLAGGTPSLLRGALVAILSMLAVSVGRPTHRLPLVLTAAVGLAVINPLGMRYNLSWQLSFLAFVGLLFFNPYLQQSIGRLPLVGSGLAETLSAELMVLPLVLYQFGTISVVSPLLNTVVLTVTPLAMGLSFLQTVVALVSSSLGSLFAWVSYPVLAMVVWPVQWASDLPFAAYEVGELPVVYFSVSYAMVGVLFLLLWWRYGKYTSE